MLQNASFSSFRSIYRPTRLGGKQFFTSSARILKDEGQAKASDLQERIDWLEKFHALKAATNSEHKFPKDWITTTFSRSGGAGGQNVNKVNTKAEIRLDLNAATAPSNSSSDYLPSLTKGIIRYLVNNSPYYVASSHELKITSTHSRSQSDNLKDALEKMQNHLIQTISKDIPGETSEEQRKKVKKMIELENGKRLQSKEKRKNVKSSRRVSRGDVGF